MSDMDRLIKAVEELIDEVKKLREQQLVQNHFHYYQPIPYVPTPIYPTGIYVNPTPAPYTITCSTISNTYG